MTGIQKTTTKLVIRYLKERQQQILTLTAVQRCQQQIYNSLFEENNSTTAISI